MFILDKQHKDAMKTLSESLINTGGVNYKLVSGTVGYFISSKCILSLMICELWVH